MHGRLLDTNAVIALQRGEAALIRMLDKEEAEWYLSATVLGELYYGAYRSTRVEDNVAVVDAISQGVVILPIDEHTARLFGEIHQQLRAKGTPIPENDIWIAATAKQYTLTVVTRDDHFSHVEGLMTATWVE
ncbi:MAG: type II toxin-antitoxin system VapC family toxin [Chloroflexi bacterium]|nr:type II toxin-antitoxin system VapC family toxin [Chloroflexota bacterium]